MERAPEDSHAKLLRDLPRGERSVVSRWTEQFVALSKKNVAILTWKWRSSLLIIFLPSLFVVGLYYLTNSLSKLDSSARSFPLSRCTAFDITSLPYSPAEPCVTIAWAPSGDSDARAIMTRVAESTGLQLGSDLVEHADAESMAGWAYDHATRQVDASVYFTPQPGPGRARYEIWVNDSLPLLYSNNGLDPIWKYTGYSGRTLALQRELDAAIVSHAVGKSISFDATVAPFDMLDPLSGAVSDPSTFAVYIVGAAFLVMGVIGGTLLLLITVTGEKQRKLLGSLRTIGLLDSAYWLSWIVTYAPIFLVMALISPAAGVISKIILFTRVEYGLHVIALFLLALSTGAMTLACAACLNRPFYVNMSAFCFFAVAVAMSIIYTVTGINRILYRPDFPPALAVLCMHPFPFVHYSRLMTTFMQYILTGGASLGSAANTQGGAAAPVVFGWPQMTQTPPSTTVYVNSLPQTFTDRPASFDLAMMFILFIAYLLLAIYMGALNAGSPVYFFLLPSWWGLASPPSLPEVGDTLAEVQAESARDGTVRAHKLSKSYKALQALKEVTLTLQPSALTALLGQNGAGKSTLIGLLSGLTSPTHGSIYMLGRAVPEEIGCLRDVMGMCPQDDLLWEELSSSQHLSLFGAFKGLSGDKLSSHVIERLEHVSLGKEAHSAVATFSGGMKRRLSVALASIGAPRIIFFDEPTTGLDPLSRRQVWDIIESLKPNRILLLTTHSMEEADSLADSVAILANGRLRAVGTPLALKTVFGSGYSISIIANPARIDTVRELVRTHLHEAVLVGDVVSIPNATVAAPPPGAAAASPSVGNEMRNRSAMGALTVSVPHTALHLIPQFIKLLTTLSEAGAGTDAADETRLVREWGLSLSSLEEVFLKLAKTERDVTAPGEEVARGVGRAVPHRQCALCEAAPTAPVTVFNAARIEVVANDLLCAECATRDAKALEDVRSTLSLQRRALIDSLTVGSTTTAAPGSTDGFALTAEPHDAGIAAASDSAEVGLPGSVNDVHDDAPPLPLPKPLWSRTPSSDAGPSKSEPPPPVSFFAQFYSVLLLILRISAPKTYTARGLCCSRACASLCIVIIAVLLTFLTSGLLPGAPITLAHCPGGYWAANYSGVGLCDRDTFIRYTTKAVSNTDSYAPYWYPSRQRRAESGRARATESGADTLNPTAVLLYKDFCATKGDFPPCFTGGPYRALDFYTLSRSYWRGSVDPDAMIAFTEAAAVASGGGNFSKLDLYGGGFNASMFGHSIQLLDLGATSSTSSDVNSWLMGVQRTVLDNQQVLNGSCSNYYFNNDGNGGGGFGFVTPDLKGWAAKSLPVAGVAMRSLAPTAATPSLAYDLRVTMLQSKNGNYRGNNNGYQFLLAVDPPASSSSCSYVSINWMSDTIVGDSMQSAYQSGGLSGYLTLSALHGSFLRSAMTTVSNDSTAAAAYIQTAFAPLPPLTWIPGAGLAPPSPYQTLIWPLFTMTTLPGIVSFLSTERADKLWALMSMSGVRRGPYLCAHFAAGVLSFVPLGALYVMVGALAGTASFTSPSPVLLAALIFVWAFAQAGWGIFFGSIIGSPRIGAILMYILAVAVSVTNFLVTQFVTPWPAGLTWAPLVSYARASTLVLSAGGLPSGLAGRRIAEALGATALEGAIALCVGVYLHAVIPGPESAGVTLDPLFPIQWLAALCHRRTGRAMSKQSSWLNSEVVVVNPSSPAVDSDVSLEKARASTAVKDIIDGAAGGAAQKRPPAILLSMLRKHFPAPLTSASVANRLRGGGPAAPKRAVDGVSLTVPYGETLGLLGPNGAGKTTLISMLVGGATATSGVAFIAGLDVENDLDRVWRTLGVCPQFDCVWPDLSVRHHLEFYARAKGIDAVRLRAAVQKSAEKVGLDGDSFGMAAGTLSGGQRRRLSIAIALLGDPDVVFLVRPS